MPTSLDWDVATRSGAIVRSFVPATIRRWMRTVFEWAYKLVHRVEMPFNSSLCPAHRPRPIFICANWQRLCETMEWFTRRGFSLPGAIPR